MYCVRNHICGVKRSLLILRYNICWVSIIICILFCRRILEAIVRHCVSCERCCIDDVFHFWWTCALGSKRCQILTKKTQHIFEYMGLIWALLKRISKPYVSLMYCHILPYLCEILFFRSLKKSLKKLALAINFFAGSSFHWHCIW